MKTCTHYANLLSLVPLAAGYVPLQMERTQYSSITNQAEHRGTSRATGALLTHPYDFFITYFKMKIKNFFFIILLLVSSFNARSQNQPEFKNSISISLTRPIGIKNYFYSSKPFEYSLLVEKKIYKKINLCLSYSSWNYNRYGSPQITDYNPTPKPGEIFYRYNYHFLELGPSLKFFDFKIYKISLLPQVSFVWGTNWRLIYWIPVATHTNINGYNSKESKLGLALKAKADFKIYKDRFNMGINGGYRFYPHYNYNYKKGYFQLNFGINLGVNF